jgi:hypothetical protein
MGEAFFRMIAIKRRWVSEWLFAALSSPVDLIVHQPFRWIFTKSRQPFRPFVWVNEDGGLVELFLEDVPCYHEWIKGAKRIFREPTQL